VKHIKDFKDYKNSKINEEFIGGLFKGLKNKISLGFSKMFGSANKADKLIEEYKKEISKVHTTKMVTLKAYSEYIKADQKDKDKENQLLKNINEASKKFDEQIKLIKQKFDIKFKEIVDEEENKKIQNYINLKKIEMQQEFLAQEIKSMMVDSEMNEDDIDPKARQIIKDLRDKSKAVQRMQKEQKQILELEEQKELGFDLNKAKELSSQGKTYLWEGSPMKKYKFEIDDRIKFFSTSNRGETRAIVLEDLGEKIKIKTENGNEVEINKMSVISSDNYDRKNSKSKSSKSET
jgi:hypothetical protein